MTICPLAQIKVGDSCRIKELLLVDQNTNLRLKEMGFFKGANIKVITKDFVCTVVGDFYLQDVSIVVQSYLLGDFERKHGLKLVLFSLISCNLTSDKIYLGLCRTELIWINIFVVAKELVKLLREIQR